MFYWGKIIGTISGLATGRLWMVLIGLLIGHQFDRRLAERFFHYQRKKTDAQRVQNAYRSLRISESSTNAEIKQAYRRLMNKNHPDKLASKNLDAVAISEAERKTREIRSAYEMLKARRSIR